MVAMQWRIAGLAVLTVLSVAGAARAEDFPLTGTYVQNRPCKGDGTDAKPLLVTIGPDEIEYRGGTCVMNDKRQEGNALSTRVTCKGKSGSILSGEITFTLRPDKNLDMIDQEKTYKAVLNRCPS